jgi:hypothetical protein
VAATDPTATPVSAWVVRAYEPDPPPAAEPVEWILLTSLPVHTLTQARQMVTYYTCRWLCEDYHMCLKTGCAIEARQLDDGQDIQRLLGFMAPIATRLLQLRHAASHAPDRLACDATDVLDPLMVRVLALRQKLALAALTLAEFWIHVARLGGYLARASDGPPGWRTLWHGWRLLSDLTDGARLAPAVAQNTSSG